MERAIRNPQPTSSGSSSIVQGETSAEDLAVRRRQLEIDGLTYCRDLINTIDPASKESWQTIVSTLLKEGGFTPDQLEAEFAASANTLYKWRTGLAAPREMTRRLLRKAVIELIDDRIEARKSGG